MLSIVERHDFCDPLVVSGDLHLHLADDHASHVHDVVAVLLPPLKETSKYTVFLRRTVAIEGFAFTSVFCFAILY
jgi:hypothetical protein